MTVRPNFAWVGGRVVPFAEASVPLDDRGLQFGESLYEVVAVTAGVARLLPEHVLRMRRASGELGLETGVPELPEWERFVSDLIHRERLREGLLYAQVTGGSAPREHAPDVAPVPTFFAYLTPFSYPRDADVVRGIRAVSLPDIRWARRDLKTTMLLPAVLAKRVAKERGASEAILVGAGGEVYEGASSNVFVVEGGTIVTPTQSKNLLPGTVRPLVLEAAHDAGHDMRSEAVSLERLARAEEAFISSTSLLVMPIVELDGRPINDAKSGPTARDLATRIRRRFALPD